MTSPRSDLAKPPSWRRTGPCAPSRSRSSGGSSGARSGVPGAASRSRLRDWGAWCVPWCSAPGSKNAQPVQLVDALRAPRRNRQSGSAVVHASELAAGGTEPQPLPGEVADMDCQLVGDEAPLRPEVWLPWVQRAVRRIDATQDRAEIESLAVLLMFLYLRAGRNVRNLAGIARAIVRTALGRTRRRRDVRGLRYDFDPDRVAREVDPAGMESDGGGGVEVCAAQSPSRSGPERQSAEADRGAGARRLDLGADGRGGRLHGARDAATNPGNRP